MTSSDPIGEVESVGRTRPGPALHRPWCPQGTAATDRLCDAPCPEAHRGFVLAATILGSAMAFIDGTVVHIALPAIQSSIGATFGELQWVVNIYTLLLGALILVGGALGDRLGRRRVFMIGIAIFAVASVLCGLAPGPLSLIAARALQGIGGALLVPQSLAIIAASFPQDQRGRAIGLWAGFAALTTALGPVLGGAFIDLLSWRAVFWINLPIAAATLWLAVRYVPESRDDGATATLDFSGAALVVVGLGALTLGLTAWPERGLSNPMVSGALAFGVLSLIGFLIVEGRVRAPMMPLSLFRSVRFSAANLITLFLYFALSGMLFLVPFNLIQLQGYTALETGMALLPFGVVMGLFSSLAGRLIDAVGPRVPLVAGPLIVAASCAGLAWTGLSGGYWVGVFGPILLLAVGLTISVAPLTTAVMNAVPERDAGVASGINNAASRLAGLVAVAVVGALAATLFSRGLEAGLPELAIDTETGSALLHGARDLAGVAIPASLSTDTAAALRDLIDASFLDGFRMSMAVSAACAGGAALTAFLFLGGSSDRVSKE